MKHLWEVDHEYYCNEGNYFSNECCHEYSSWADFMSCMGDADIDMNLVFRWDWKEEEDSFKGDIYYRNGTLQVCYMGQRKGLYSSRLISICRADEPEVIKFLQPKLDHLLSLWLPLIPSPPKE